MTRHGKFKLKYLTTTRVVEVLLWLLIAFLPWPFGVVDAWSEWVVGAIVTALAVCLAWQVMFKTRTFVFTWALVPLLGLLAMAFLSMTPLPGSIVNMLSPRSVQIRQELLSHLPVGSANPQTMTLSFYTLATTHMARLLICSLIVFACVVNFYRKSDQVIRLMVAITAVGGVLATEAVLQGVSSNGLIYWVIPAPVKSTSGPFVNYNNFCQFLNLAIGAGVGLLLNLIHERGFRGRQHAIMGMWELLGDAGRRYLMLLFVMLLMSAVAVLMSTSRGGVLSMVGAAAVITVLLIAMRDLDMPLKVLSLVGLTAVFLLFGWGFDTFLDRMGTLSNLENASGARAQVFRDVIHEIPQFAMVGTGLGTHEVVYPMFSNLNTWRNAAYVENEYIQLIEEMGIVGVLLVGAFVGVIVRSFIAAIRRRDTGLFYAALGLGYGLVAIAVASISDFGQRLASISCLTAMVCGLIVAIQFIDRTPAAPPRKLKQPAALGISLTALLLAGWMLLGSSRAAMAEYYWGKVLPIETSVIHKDWDGSNLQYKNLLANAQEAASWQPGNVEYRCWLAIYQWHEGSRLDTWNNLTDAQRTDLFKNLVDSFQECEKICPTYGLSYAMAGQIRFMGNHDDGGADEIRKAYALAPTHRAVCFIAGRLSAKQGKWEDANTQFRRALALHYSQSEILDVYVKEVDRPDLAADVFRDDWQTLDTLATIMNKDPRYLNRGDEIRTRSENVLKADAQKSEASVQTLAAMADLLGRQGDMAASARYYRRAVDGIGGYGNGEWHFALAMALSKTGDIDQARQELVISLRQNAPALSADHRKVAEQLKWTLDHPATRP